jgi:hypothetical protein
MDFWIYQPGPGIGSKIIRATIEKGPRSRDQWIQAILLVKSFKIGPKAFRQGSKPKQWEIDFKWNFPSEFYFIFYFFGFLMEPWVRSWDSFSEFFKLSVSILFRKNLDQVQFHLHYTKQNKNTINLILVCSTSTQISREWLYNINYIKPTKCNNLLKM